MKTAFITRSTLFSAPGGDTTQVMQTARWLRQSGVDVSVLLSSAANIRYTDYDLLHFINIIRPADILFHIKKTRAPFIVSPVFVDYSEYDQVHRKGVAGLLFRKLDPHRIEYLKTCARWFKRTDTIKSMSYLWKGQKKSIECILQKTAMLLPNSLSEMKRIQEIYQLEAPYKIVPNGIDLSVFQHDGLSKKEQHLVLCVARIEGIKNQLNLIRALNGTKFKLILIGNPSPNQEHYYRACKKLAKQNISFIPHLPQQDLLAYYKKAAVHILPSWFETCGLSSLEAAAMNCNIVITAKGFTSDYFGSNAVYCDPGDPDSILAAVERASQQETQITLREKILQHYTWQKAAAVTLQAYKKVLKYG